MKNIYLTLLSFLFVFSSTQAQSPVVISAFDTPYTQNFNLLTTASSWSDGVTLQGWYAKDGNGIPTGYGLNNGNTTGTPPFLFSFGETASADRSLGFVPNKGNGTKHYIGLRLKNTTGSTITKISISWDGEQWRNGSTLTQSLPLSYKISATPFTNIPITGLIYVNQFVGPKSLPTGVPAYALNGNDAENRTTLNTTINLSLPNNHEIMFVWQDNRNLFELDQFFAIDNISVSATTKSSQSIDFPELADQIYGDAPFTLEAEASSELPVTFQAPILL